MKNEDQHVLSLPQDHKKVLGKLKILYKNDDFVIVEKPAGIIVNNSDTAANEVTLQDLIEKSDLIDKYDPDVDFIARSGIVHRLDKETSGVLIVARNSAAFKNLQSQFKERRVEKSYIALVHGKIEPEQGEISVPVGRLPWNRKRFGVISGGREARTEYQVLSILYLVSNGKKEPLSFVRLFPKTGRTHQIRVHLKYINHPIFGDPLYGGRKTSREDRKLLPRIFLHAEKISFTDPKSGKALSFESPLPYDLKKFTDSLERVEKE